MSLKFVLISFETKLSFMQPFTTVCPSLLKLSLDSSDVQNTIQQRLHVYLYVVNRASYVHKKQLYIEWGMFH